VLLTFTTEMLTDFPAAAAAVLTATGLRNDAPWPESDELIRTAEEFAASGGLERFDEESPYIATWHAAYRAFGTNPRRFRPSVDALIRRVRKSGALPRISPAVDAYNAISVATGLPAGAVDLGCVDGDIELRYARAGDKFEPLGEDGKVEEARPGEAVYADRAKVVTRHWNHRDSALTMLRPETRNAVFVFERVGAEIPTAELTAAAERLAAAVTPHADAVQVALLDATHPQLTLG
jgi:DNA/RNA-binding domain of Phe-tRNA-synthetase-like protein